MAKARSAQAMNGAGRKTRSDEIFIISLHMKMRKITYCTAEKHEDMIDHHGYVHELRSCEIKG